MRLLIAEDSLVSRRLLEAMFTQWGYEVVVTNDGLAAWQVLQRPDAPPLAIVDWMMPGMDGLDLCRKVREAPEHHPRYIILLTAKSAGADLVAALQAGADDYVTKPFDREELLARVKVGVRTVQLQQSLADRVRELEEARLQVKRLSGLLPICAYCKKIRDDKNYWQEVEGYIIKHSEAQFSHGICPDCYERCVKPELERVRAHKEERHDLR